MLDMPANAPGSIVEWLSSLPCIETVRVLRLSRPWNVPAWQGFSLHNFDA